MKIKVLMADDHALFRDGMRYVLQQLADDVEILDSGNFQDALQLVHDNPDVDLALLDLNMPGSEGVPSIQFFHLRHPDIPLVVVSGSDHRDDIESVMESGAMGFISKMSSSKIMLSALRMVLEGGVYLPPQLLQQAVKHRTPLWQRNLNLLFAVSFTGTTLSFFPFVNGTLSSASSWSKSFFSLSVSFIITSS